MMALSPGDRVDLKERVVATLQEQQPLAADLRLQEFDFSTQDEWEGSSEAYLLAMLAGRDKDEQLQALDNYLHPPAVDMPESGSDTAKNTQFTVDEQREIARQLGELKIHVEQTYSLSGEQMRLLEAQMSYLEDAASRLGRIDWRNAAAGVFLGVMVNTVLPRNATRDVLILLFRSIGHMFGHPMPELPPGL